MTSDEIISMLHACENVIQAERQLDGISDGLAIQTLRESVRTLAVIQRDLLKSVLQ